MSGTVWIHFIFGSGFLLFAAAHHILGQICVHVRVLLKIAATQPANSLFIRLPSCHVVAWIISGAPTCLRHPALTLTSGILTGMQSTWQPSRMMKRTRRCLICETIDQSRCIPFHGVRTLSRRYGSTTSRRMFWLRQHPTAISCCMMCVRAHRSRRF